MEALQQGISFLTSCKPSRKWCDKIKAEEKAQKFLSFSTNKTKFYLHFSPTLMSSVFSQTGFLNYIILVLFKILNTRKY